MLRFEVRRVVTHWGRNCTMEFVVDGSEDILAEYLTAEGIYNDLVTKIHDNRVTCSLFLDLSEEDLASVIDRIAFHRTLEKARKVIEVSIAGCLTLT